MATTPTPEEVARAILARFKEMNARAGHVLLGNNVVAIQVKYGFTQDELLQGLQYAGDQGWIENGPNSSIKLTESGFAAI